jgi:hypothetical protein
MKLRVEDLNLAFRSDYSMRTTKTADVLVQVTPRSKTCKDQRFCKLCSARIDADAAFCRTLVKGCDAICQTCMKQEEKSFLVGGCE